MKLMRSLLHDYLLFILISLSPPINKLSPLCARVFVEWLAIFITNSTRSKYCNLFANDSLDWFLWHWYLEWKYPSGSWMRFDLGQWAEFHFASYFPHFIALCRNYSHLKSHLLWLLNFDFKAAPLLLLLLPRNRIGTKNVEGDRNGHLHTIILWNLFMVGSN